MAPIAVAFVDSIQLDVEYILRVSTFAVVIMRIIGGKFRSRSLQSLPGQDTRPTYDRLRETLFNVLSAAGLIEGGVFVDLFAGTGSIGIEALSRGAAHVYFVENAKKAAQVIRANLQSLGVTTGTEVWERTAADALRLLNEAENRADVIFLDPPYKMRGAYEQVLRVLSQTQVLRTGGVVVAEHEKRFDPGDGVTGICRYRRLDQGESSLSFYRRQFSEPAERGETPE